MGASTSHASTAPASLTPCGKLLFAAVVVFGSIAAAWPIATMLVGSPFDSPAPRLMLVPAASDATSYFKVPTFEHTNQLGRRFGSEQLAGQVWIASFFFTSCRTVCPQMMDTLQRLQPQLKASVRSVSFTVDPQTDTPDRLAEYATSFQADPDRWVFLTDTAGAIERTVVAGFKQPMGSSNSVSTSDSEAALQIAHGQRLVLVDRNLEVRGLYDLDEASLKTLVEDANAL